MPRATVVKGELLNAWHFTTVQFSCGPFTSHADEYPVPFGRGRGEVSLSLWVFVLSDCMSPRGWGGHKLGNRVQQMLCLLSCSLRPPTVSFPFLWPMLPEKSNHAHFPAWLVPRAEAATFPITGSSAMAAAVAAPEHWAMKTAALQQVFELATLSPISLPPDTHMNSACPSTEIQSGGSRAKPHAGQSPVGKQSSCSSLPAGTVPQTASPWPLTLLFTMRKIQDLMFLLIEPFPSPRLWEGKTISMVAWAKTSGLHPVSHLEPVSKTFRESHPPTPFLLSLL